MYEVIEANKVVFLWNCCQRGKDIQKWKREKEGQIYKSERFISEGQMYPRGRSIILEREKW